MEPTGYLLKSAVSGRLYADNGWMLDSGEDGQGLLCSVYDSTQLTDRGASAGLFRFADWLPVSRVVPNSNSPVTYKSTALAARLGLENLWITFSGYWPEKGAAMSTCSFKETEAYSVISRLRPDEKKILVVASAGNTARAFARVCSDNDVPVIICIPADNLGALWYDRPIAPCVKVIATQHGSDYADAIELADVICRISGSAVGVDGFIPEGGAKNIARRDGMGTTVLSAATTIGRIPDVYFQAIGSGTGAIAAWEASKRLLADGRFGTNVMRLMLSQNAPFTPIYDAWCAGTRDLAPVSPEKARVYEKQIMAPVLANRRPPYSIAGGLYDALTATGGNVASISNDEACRAGALFAESEGVDICSAASVAVASLVKAVANGSITSDEVIMLNVTGGGEVRYRNEHVTTAMRPDRIVDAGYKYDDIVDVVKSLFA